MPTTIPHKLVPVECGIKMQDRDGAHHAFWSGYTHWRPSDDQLRELCDVFNTSRANAERVIVLEQQLQNLNADKVAAPDSPPRELALAGTDAEPTEPAPAEPATDPDATT